MDENETRESTVFSAAYDPAELLLLRTKNDIRRMGIVVGLPMVLLMLGMIYTQTLIVRVAVALGYREEIVSLLGKLPGSEAVSVVISSLYFVGLFTLFCRLSGNKVGRVTAFGRPKAGVTLPLLCIGVGVCTFANLGAAQLEQYFSWFPFSYHWSYDNGSSTGFFAVALALISSAVVPALVEEFACRGVVFGLLEKYGQDFAVVTTAVLFGMMHGNFSQIPFAVTVGFVLGFVRAKSGSVWPAVALHFINNAISCLLSTLAKLTSNAAAGTAQTVYFLLSLLLTAVGVVWLELRDKGAWRLTPFGEISFGKRCGWFFSSPMVIIFLLIAVGEACYFFF